MRTDRLRAAYQIEFQYTLFPLHPETPDEGLSLEQLFAGRSFDILPGDTGFVRKVRSGGAHSGSRAEE